MEKVSVDFTKNATKAARAQPEKIQSSAKSKLIIKISRAKAMRGGFDVIGDIFTGKSGGSILWL